MVYVSPHALRHDPETARAARTLREVDARPTDWLEGPRDRRAGRLLPPPAPCSPFERLALALVVIALGALLLVGLLTVIEALR
jgi:hypothetical protein